MGSLSTVFLLSALFLCPAHAQAGTFLWEKLTPSQDLEWVECYSTFQCARLEVPLDYSDSTVGTAALAIIRLPANSSQAEYRGPILFNPGGPGGSGVDVLVSAGSGLQAILADSRYDVVSFDPRGVQYSTPQASVFATAAERALWNAGSLPLSLSASPNAIPQAWGRAHLFGTLAAQRDESQILKYLTTDNGARDMLQITQKMGFEKLKYYGVSYGSLLGAMFAAMFPDKVERIIIDGVLDVEAWLHANLTIEATDTDKVLQSFFDGCVAAGPDSCAYYAPTAAEIAHKLATLTESIRAQPVPVITPTAYGLVDYSLLRQAIFSSLYDPYNQFPTLVHGLAALEKGDGTALYAMQARPPFECNCTGTTCPLNDDSVVAIECGDAVNVTDSIGQLTEFYDNAVKTSQFVEFFMGSDRVSCAGWQVYRDDRFLGPVAANTSFPLLLVSNTADPVTPKAAALKTQAGFPGSVLLTQDSPGHTSLSVPSLCTSGYFRAYMVNGTLPLPGTVCPVDGRLFEPPANSTAKRTALDVADEDERRLVALKVLGDSVRPIMRKMRRGN